MSTSQCFISIVFLIFIIKFLGFLRAMITCNDLFKGIVKIHSKSYTCSQLAVFQSSFSKSCHYQLHNVIWLLPRDVYLRYLMRVLPLIEISLLMCYAIWLNGFYVLLYFMIIVYQFYHEYKASLITLISIDIYFCYNLD